MAVAPVRRRLASWWWDLSLRWKGMVVVALSILALVPCVVAGLLLLDRQGDVGALLAGVALAAGVACVAIWLFTRSIVHRIDIVSGVAASVVGGDTSLDIEEPAADEIGTLFRELMSAAGVLFAMNAELAASRDGERDRLEQERVMSTVVRQVRKALGQIDVLAATVRELGPATGADRALVVAAEEGTTGSVVAEWHVDELSDLGVGPWLPPDEQRDANFALVLRQRHAFAIDDVANSALLPQTKELLGDLGVGSLLLAPVVADEESLGAIVLLTIGRTRPWPPGSDRLAENVAADVATALTHARLYEREREMVERLRDLDQAKSDFVASVSHELRTPLTSIRGFLELLRDGDAGPLTPEQEHMLGVVQRNADRLLALIEDLLTLSQIESGAFRVVRAPVALADVVRAAVAELRPQAAGRGVELVDDIESDLPDVLGDVAQLERVLFNLLSNAIKFSPDGGHVAVRLGRCGEACELEIADDGIGIPESEQDRLFSRFFRSSAAQERAIQGTGLGLVIVKSIVDHHDGTIAVRSRPGDGTTFTVRLPVAVAAPVDQEFEQLLSAGDRPGAPAEERNGGP